jgi:hypothetical protein
MVTTIESVNEVGCSKFILLNIVWYIHITSNLLSIMSHFKQYNNKSKRSGYGVIRSSQVWVIYGIEQ